MLELRGVDVSIGAVSILRGVELDVGAGQFVGLIGRNGAGKTTLLRTLAGLQTPTTGAVTRNGRVAYVPQEPGALFQATTVRGEVAATLSLLRRHDDDAIDAWLDRLDLTGVAARHPRALSGGQRQRLAVAAVAVGAAPVLCLDEPTRGMDAPSQAALERAVAEHAESGGAVVIATHDVELAARVAHRVVVLGDGDVVADGDARTVLSGSLFAPQVLRTLPPYLTVDDVRAAIP
jgi:energy-coupling factor transport system ATP-binding protein